MYSDWLSQGPGEGSGKGPGRMSPMVLRTFYTIPEQGQGLEEEQGSVGYVPFRCPVLVPETVSVNTPLGLH